MKKRIVVLLLFTSALLSFQLSNMFSEDQVIGTWKWISITDQTTGQSIGVSEMSMGMLKELRTEFKKDFTYSEHAKDMEGNVNSKIVGTWKLEQNNTMLTMISYKNPDKIKSGKIIKLNQDSLIIEMGPDRHGLLIRNK